MTELKSRMILMRVSQHILEDWSREGIRKLSPRMIGKIPAFRKPTPWWYGCKDGLAMIHDLLEKG